MLTSALLLSLAPAVLADCIKTGAECTVRCATRSTRAPPPEARRNA